MVLLLGAFQCGLQTGPTSPGLSPPPAPPILNLHWLGGLACPTLYLPGNALHPTHKLPMASPFPGSQSHPMPPRGWAILGRKRPSAPMTHMRPVHYKRDFWWRATGASTSCSVTWVDLWGLRACSQPHCDL